MLVSIASNVLQYKSDLIKQDSYAINLKFDNFENKLHQTVNAVG